MAINLKELKPQQISKNLRGKYIMFYGNAGVGKTTLASKFKDVLIAGFEQGTNALNNVYVQPVKTWQDWRDMVRQLQKDKELQEKFQSIAIDTADEAWDLCVKHVCGQNGIASLDELPWGKGYDLAKKEFRSTFRELTYSGYGLIFISHSIEKEIEENGEKTKKIVPALQNTPFQIINKMVDIVAYIREVSNNDRENPQTKRFIFLRDETGKLFFAKSRYKYITPRIELGYQALVDAIYEAIDKEVQESGGECTNEKNPYSEKTFEEMMSEARELWNEGVAKGRTEQIVKILSDTFGREIKFSQITPEEKDKLNDALIEIHTIF